MNAAIDRVWPAAATAAAREANERIRQAQVAEYVARTAAVDDDEADPDMPSEFPERWSRFLPRRTSRPACAPTRRTATTVPRGTRRGRAPRTRRSEAERPPRPAPET
ncbi:hypothetical protein SHIRM173S_05012 [Streptomyces hirsutus]